MKLEDREKTREVFNLSIRLQTELKEEIRKAVIEDLKEANMFELAGYNKEESKELAKECNKMGIPYNIMLSALRSFEPTKAWDKVKEEWREWENE